MELKLVRHDDRCVIVALAGRLDVAGVNAVEPEFLALAADAHKPVVVDLAQVAFLASMAMRMLLSAAKALRRSGAHMVLLNPQELVAKALATAGLDQVIPVAQNLDQALGTLQPSQGQTCQDPRR